MTEFVRVYLCTRESCRAFFNLSTEGFDFCPGGYMLPCRDCGGVTKYRIIPKELLEVEHIAGRIRRTEKSPLVSNDGGVLLPKELADYLKGSFAKTRNRAKGDSHAEKQRTIHQKVLRVGGKYVRRM